MFLGPLRVKINFSKPPKIDLTLLMWSESTGTNHCCSNIKYVIKFDFYNIFLIAFRCHWITRKWKDQNYLCSQLGNIYFSRLSEFYLFRHTFTEMIFEPSKNFKSAQNSAHPLSKYFIGAILVGTISSVLLFVENQHIKLIFLTPFQNVLYSIFSSSFCECVCVQWTIFKS